MRAATARRVAFAVLALAVPFAPTKEAIVSEVFIEDQPLPKVVHLAPIIVIGRLSQPEPDLRTIKLTVENRDGERVDFRFEGEVWRFTVLEVLKAEGAAPPEGEIEVVDVGLQMSYNVQYEYETSGIGISPMMARNITDYVDNVRDLNGRAAILFLSPPSAPEFIENDPFLSRFGRAYTLTAWPGLEDPALRERVLELVRTGAL